MARLNSSKLKQHLDIILFGLWEVGSHAPVNWTQAGFTVDGQRFGLGMCGWCLCELVHYGGENAVNYIRD